MKRKDTIHELQNKQKLMDEAYSRFKKAQKIGDQEMAIESLNHTLKHASSILDLSMQVINRVFSAKDSSDSPAHEEIKEKETRKKYVLYLSNSDMKTIN